MYYSLHKHIVPVLFMEVIKNSLKNIETLQRAFTKHTLKRSILTQFKSIHYFAKVITDLLFNAVCVLCQFVWVLVFHLKTHSVVFIL